MTRPCPTCNGEGVIKSEETIAIEFERRMRELAPKVDAEALLLQMNPRVSQEFTGHDARVLSAIEHETGKWFHFEGSEGLPLDHFAVLMEADRQEVLERALPFREGEEVYLEIIEPHMYSAGDAVAKVDGYIISVKDAENAVGQKRLVQIREVGRTQAVAVLIDQPPVVEARTSKPPKLQIAASDTSAAPVRKTPARRSKGASGPAETDPPEVAETEAIEVAQTDPPDVAESGTSDPTKTDAPQVTAAAEAGDEAAPVPSRRSSRPRRAAKPKPESGAQAPVPAGAVAGNGTAEEAPVPSESDSAANVHASGTGDDTAVNGTDGVESPVRRRGRRGGRRRSAAKAGAAATVEETSSE
jgi:ribonuclease G